MGARMRNTIIVCAIATLGGASMALSYTVLVDGDEVFGAVIGAAITLPIVVFEMFVMRGHLGAPIRRLPIWGLVLVSFGTWIGSILLGMLVVAPAVMGLESYPQWYFQIAFKQDVIFAMLVVVFVNFGMRIHSLIGTRVLLNFLLGRYHRPLREQQIFMFLDFLDARGMSRRLGDTHAQSLIAAALFDLDEIVLEFGGETHRYIADELVVTWPLARGVKDARCLRCALAIETLMRSRSEHYLRVYGEAPRLRMALHGGPVVVSEIGDDRREIVYFGDTINTTARLRGLAKKIGRNLVVSAELLDRMPLPAEVRTEDMGRFELSGKVESTRVFAVQGAA